VKAQELPLERRVHDREPGLDTPIIRPGQPQAFHLVSGQVWRSKIRDVDPCLSGGPRGAYPPPAWPAALTPTERGDPLLQHYVDLVSPAQQSLRTIAAFPDGRGRMREYPEQEQIITEAKWKWRILSLIMTIPSLEGICRSRGAGSS
jgi:hypothetical protein